MKGLSEKQMLIRRAVCLSMFRPDRCTIQCAWTLSGIGLFELYRLNTVALRCAVITPTVFLLHPVPVMHELG